MFEPRQLALDRAGPALCRELKGIDLIQHGMFRPCRNRWSDRGKTEGHREQNGQTHEEAPESSAGCAPALLEDQLENDCTVVKKAIC